MARKYELITKLYNDTVIKVTKSQVAWRDFLRSACNNYKCSFDEQVLIYAQRPKATAVLEIEKWNKLFGRWVNRGAAGIAVFDSEHNGRYRLKHYFDISDTHSSANSRTVPIWEMQEHHEDEVIDALVNSFGDIEYRESADVAILNIVSNVIDDNYHDYLDELLDCREDSFLEELDELNVKVSFQRALECSVSYMLLERCLGGAADQYADIIDFSSIVDFNTPKTITALGTATSDMAEMVLREVALTIRNIDKREKNSNRTVANPKLNNYTENKKQSKLSERSVNNGDNLQQTGRLLSTQSSTPAGGTGTPREIRINPQDIPQKSSQDNIHQPTDTGHTQQPSNGNREDSAKEIGTNSIGDGKSQRIDGGTQSQRPDEMGGTDEQYPTFGGGNDTQRTNLQLENSQKADSQELPAFLDDSLVMGIISNKNDDLIYKKSQIELFFSIHSDEKERAEYLKSAYQDRYTEIIIDGKRVGYKPETAGILMWEGSYLKRTSESIFSWELASELTARLIDKKEYRINRDIKPLKSQDGQQMSLFDFNYDMPTTSDNQFSFFKGFEISQEVIDQALCLGGNEPKFLERICSYFAKDYPIEKNAEFLREEYKTDGKGFYSGSNLISLWFDEKGIQIAEGKTAESNNSTFLSWTDVAKRVRELLDMGQYAPNSVLEHSAANNERKDLAATLWYIVQDFSDNARSESLMPTILEIYNGRGGFPDNTAEIEKLLKDDEIVKKLVTELTDFVDKYDENPALLRFAFHRPKRTLEQLKGLLRPQLEFTVHPDFSYEPKQFITNDEIDRILISSRGSASKHRINEYFLENHTPKECIALLKKLYGTGGSVRLGFNNSYDAKGFLCSRGNISTPYDKVLLKWNQVEKRIGELIKRGRYLTDEDRNEYAKYLDEQAAWQKKAERQVFINNASDLPPAEKRDTLPLRLSYFIHDLDGYEKKLLSDVERSDLADVTAEQMQQHLNNPDTVKQLINFLALVQGRTASVDSRNNSWHFGEELKELPPLYYEKPQEQAVKEKPEEETKDSAIALYSNDFEKIAIILTPNEKYYNYYGYDENSGRFNTRAGAFDSFEHAEKALYSHRPTAKKLSERDVKLTPLAGNLEQEQENSNVHDDKLKIGTELTIDDRNFVIDSINEEWDKVSLKDITFQNSTGFPVFRSESIDFVNYVIAEQKKKQELLELVEGKLDESGYVVSDELLEQGLEDYSGKGNYEDIADFIEKEYLIENQSDDELLNLENQIKHRLDAVSDSKGYSELKKDVQRLLLDKNGDSLVGITSDVWIKQLLELSSDEFRKYADEYQSGTLNAYSLLKPIENSNDLQAKEEKIPPPRPIREQIRFTKQHPEIEQRYNFHITDSELGEGTASEKYAANIAAIRTLKQIENESRLATPEEQEILSRYVGWGGLASCFEENHTKYEELKNMLTEEEYTAARESTLSAYYTSPVIINAMYKALGQMGFKTGNILEPSCGTGNFIGMLPDRLAQSKVYGVEIDSISGRIAQQLYQNNNIAVSGYEDINIPDSFFDVAIGNVPFGDFKVLDQRYDKHKWLIHDYFFGKTLDKVRPGGIVAFITSKGTMDKKNSSVRKYLAQRADLVGAIRLPNNAFKGNAGTEVTSDIIFLQKRDRITDIEPDWIHLNTDENGISMNSYFVQNPDMVLGEMVTESTRFGMDSVCKAYDDADLSEQLEEAILNLHAQISEYEIDELEEDEDLSIEADPNVKNFSYTIVDGKLYFRENSRMHPVEMSVTAENRIRGMIALRDSTRNLIMFQTENYPDEAIRSAQIKLNRLYDDYTKKYGLLCSRGNSLAFGEDSSYCLLCSLEVLDDEGNFKRKADMFSKRTIKPHTPVTSVDTASEALAVSISEKACVDMDYMSNLSGKSEQELETELKGVVYRNIECATEPEHIPKAFVSLNKFSLVTADEYLSGNVRRKLQMAKALEQVLPSEEKIKLNEYINALEVVQPADLTAAEIGVRIGATWILSEIYREFMIQTFGTSAIARQKIKILYSKYTGEWNISNKNSDYINIKAVTTYGTQRINAYNIFEQTLNLKDVRIFDTIIEDGKEKRVLNKKETAIAQDRQEQIKSKFSEWIWKDINRREMLCKIYNETFNSTRPREYDGSHINFVGMNPEITLEQHQRNAVAHSLYGGNTLYAHCVGAGKTFEVIAAAMESKRLGLCSKSLVVVPNHITEQWASEWLQLYPSANILVATKKDFETKNRKKFCARIATGEFDAVIIGHSQFEKIPMSKERQVIILEEQIDEIVIGIQEAKSANAERYTIKQMERTKKSLRNKLAKLNDQSRKDDIVTFEELGVDRLFVDESHSFKNLFLMTKMRNVGGIAQTEAQKSSDLFMKTQYLNEITNNKGVVFATGTPISNSMVELYTVQRYLQYSTLQELRMQHFDEWAANFGETVTAIELSPEGTGYRAKTRFAKFYNLPELMNTFKEVADIKTADMLDLPVPKVNFHTEVIKPSELQKDMLASLAERAEAIRSGNVDSSIDNMLRVTNDGRKLALDMRLINPLSPDEPEGKVATCSNNIHRIWDETKDKRSAQIVFCDLSTPKKDGTFNVYDDLKHKLMGKGIPENEIAFIHNANTEVKKKELYAKVRSGQVRVLLGSTQKLGTGTNIQDRLIALHDCDCPWRPSDLAQRLGRICRQGNENKEVEVFRYVTEGTFDSYLYVRHEVA